MWPDAAASSDEDSVGFATEMRQSGLTRIIYAADSIALSFIFISIPFPVHRLSYTFATASLKRTSKSNTRYIPTHKQEDKMKFSLPILLGIAAAATAAPQPIRRQASASTSVAPYATGFAASTGGVYPTGTAASTGGIYPTGTVAPYPLSTGTSSCPVNGNIVCKGESMFGICNFGRITFMPVAAGTKCVDGSIV